MAQGQRPQPPPPGRLHRPGRREARRGRGRPRRDHRLRRVVRHRRVHPRVRRLVGARERGLQETRSSTARSTSCSCSPRPAPRTAPTSGSPSTPSRTSFQHPDITHVVIVAGDSDYVPLAQRCKRLGRYVVGIGVAGSTSTRTGLGLQRVHRLRRPARGDAAAAAEAARQEGDREQDGRRRPRPRRVPRRPRRRPSLRCRRTRRRCWSGPARRSPEVRRRVGLRRRGEEPDAAHQRRVQGEVAGLLLVPRLRGVPRATSSSRRSTATAS